jgi:hypothetical protein
LGNACAVLFHFDEAVFPCGDAMRKPFKDVSLLLHFKDAMHSHRTT